VDDDADVAAGAPPPYSAAEDETIRALLTRLARPHASGGEVVERATLLAEGAAFPAIIAWITDHAGIPETTAVAGPSRGLHGSRVTGGHVAESPRPLRYVLPAGTLA
jgi:hypothetical protein